MKFQEFKRKVQRLLGHPSLVTMLLSIIFLFFMMMMSPKFETNDDWNIAFQLSRGNSSFATFLLPEMSLFFNKLYEYIPIFPWWSFFSIFCGGMLLSAGLYINIKNCKGKIRIVLCFLWFLVVWVGCLKQINFTRTAVAVSLAGWIYSLEGICATSKKWKKYIQIILGLFLIIIGGMVRIQAIFLILPFVLLYACFKIIGVKVEKENKTVKKYFQLLIPFLGVGLIFVFSSYSWDKYPEWREYQDYNYYRGIVQDYPDKYPTWSESGGSYAAISLHEDDEKLFVYNWFSEDTTVFSDENIKKISGLANEDIKYEVVVQQLFSSIWNCNLVWIFILMLFFIMCVSNYRIWIFFVLEFLGATLIITYFIMQGRMQNRVADSIFLCAIGILLFYFCSEHHNKSSMVFNRMFITIKKTDYLEVGVKEEKGLIKISLMWIFSLFATIILLCALERRELFSEFTFPNKTDGIDWSIREKTNYINEDVSNVYLLPTLSMDISQGFSFWETVPNEYCSNMFFLGGWAARSPYNIEKLAEYGIDNPVRGLIDSPNVYSIYNEDIWCYLERHYGDIECIDIASFPTDNEMRIVQYKPSVEK